MTKRWSGSTSPRILTKMNRIVSNSECMDVLPKRGTDKNDYAMTQLWSYSLSESPLYEYNIKIQQNRFQRYRWVSLHFPFYSMWKIIILLYCIVLIMRSVILVRNNTSSEPLFLESEHEFFVLLLHRKQTGITSVPKESGNQKDTARISSSLRNPSVAYICVL